MPIDEGHGSPFDLLGSASLLVPDRAATTRALVDRLGFPLPKPHWHLDDGGTGMQVTFMRPMLDTVRGPTPIEVVEPTPIAPATPVERTQPQILPIWQAQGIRPVKVHATDVAAPDVDVIIARLVDLRVRHWIHSNAAGEQRVWVGVDPADPTQYRRTDDAGLHIEILPTAALGLPAAAFSPPSYDPDATEAGTMIRVEARTYLVRDLDRTLEVVEELFGWQPEGPIATSPDTSRSAVLGFRLATSPRLVLLQPAPGTEEHAELGWWGDGPWSMTIGVNGLDAKSEDLRGRGTPFRLVDGFDGRPRLRIDRSATPGGAFDLVELDQTAGV